jgi:DNA-binding beta-propeller fold protein YncE
MRQTVFVLILMAIVAGSALTQEDAAGGPYRVLKTARIGGDGGFDYVYADTSGRRLYVPRRGATTRVSVFNLDTLQPDGEIPNVGAQGVAVDPKSHHGFASSKPVAMWDTKTMKILKSIDVEGRPDGILFDSFNERVYVLSHSAPNATVINAKDGTVAGTIDLGGAPEQAASDGKGHLYIDIEDKDNVAVVDAKTLQVTGHYSLGGNTTPAGLAFDAKNGILFVECRKPAVSVIMNARDGKILKTLPIGAGVDGAGFLDNTKEAFSSQGDGTLTVIQEKSPTEFVVEQTVKTMPSSKTMAIDRKTNHILLIGAEFGPAPAVAPGERPKRGPLVPDSFTILEVGHQ